METGLWDNYVMYQGSEGLRDFASTYCAGHTDRKVAFFLGHGFDPRMNNALIEYLSVCPDAKITCYLVCYTSQHPSDYQRLIDQNGQVLDQLSEKYGFNIDTTFTLSYDDKKYALQQYVKKLGALNLEPETDVFLDISAMPRALFYTFLKGLYNNCKKNKLNFFVFATENTDIDCAIKETELAEVEPIWGFAGKSNRNSVLDPIKVLIPLLGENETEFLDKITQNDEYQDICPVLPFPSRDPRRSERLLWEYGKLFNDKLEVESSNITYAHEQNPFELYAILKKIITNYYNTFCSDDSTDIMVGMALLTSKLLSLGAFLAATEYPQNVVVLDTNAQNYEFMDGMTEDKMVELNNKSETFLLWITGEAYES